MAIEIQSADMQDGSKRLDARVADHRFAVVRLDLAGDEARAIVWPEPLMEFGQEDIGELLTGLLNEAREAGARRLRMTSPSILCRDQARRLGFCGGLREPLTISVDPAPPHRPTDASVDRQGRLLELVDVLNSFGLPTTARARRNVASRWAERLSSGVADLLDIEVSWTPGQVLVLRIPDRADLM
ncbi:MAG TPA: hypothetical protein VMF60_09125, partial [Acidimicrobiales bacterium]|nr:hypothetical protein [Acidimicrobiales bacterium]